MKIVFVILHYLAEEETHRSVESIKRKIDVDEYRILVIDNGSPDCSGERLKESYKDDINIEVILTGDNLGFAKGNNVGFRYAKEKWNPEYIVLMNNDVYLLDDDLVEKIDCEYEKSKFSVLGPMILTVDGRCNINPIRTSPASKAVVEHDLKAYKLKAFLCKYHLMGLRNLYRRIKPVSRKTAYKIYTDRCEHVQLHGCFMVFSKQYMEQFDGLDERTFLFREEAILYKHLCESGMNSVYVPDIHVFHREDASTDKMVRNTREKDIFEIKHHVDSLQILLDIYESYEKSKNIGEKQ